MLDKPEVKFKLKACPLNKFEPCIEERCAFYDESSAIEEAHNPPEDFSFCSITYLPIIYHELKEFLDEFIRKWESEETRRQ